MWLITIQPRQNLQYKSQTPQKFGSTQNIPR
jgi:hypothetical protein